MMVRATSGRSAVREQAAIETTDKINKARRVIIMVE